MTDHIGLLCTSESRGGLELNVIRMARWLTEMGCVIVILGKPGTEIEYLSAKHALRFLPIDPGPKYFDLRAGWRLRRIIRGYNLKIILVNTTADIGRAVLGKIFSLGSAHVVYLQNMQIGIKKTDPFHSWLYNRLDAWISPLPFMADQVRRLTRLNRKKIFQFPLGIELDRFIENKPHQTEARWKLGLPHNSILAGVIGRIDRQKEQDLLLRAAARLIHNNYPLDILILGEATLHEADSYAQELKALSRSLDIENHVHFRPFIEDIETAHAALDIFVLPSRNETFGLVTVEAMAAGLPIIATRSGGTPEIISDHEEGLLITPGNVGELAAALKLLMRFPDLRQHFGKAARRKAVEFFSHAQQCFDMMALFEKIS